MIIYIIPSGIDATDAKTLINYNPEDEYVTMTLDEFPEYEHSLSAINEEVKIIIVEPDKDKRAREIINIYNKDTGCWECISQCLNPNGYPRFERKGIDESVYRYVYKLHYGDPGSKYEIMHTCDNRVCTCPFHLKAGTHLQNMRDMVFKGRQARGESHGLSKLTTNDVIAILAENVSTDDELAARYNVSKQHIRNIKSGRFWKHINRNESVNTAENAA